MDRCIAGLVLALAVTLLAPSSAFARRTGIATDSCNGCHHGGQEPSVRLLASPMNPQLGQTVAITLEIDAVNGSVGGFFVEHDGAGTFQTAASSGMQAFNAMSLGHTAPKMASGGVVRFTFSWTAPSTPGGVVLRASALSANGDNTPEGDAYGKAQLLLAFGCTGTLYTVDPDRDGYGSIEYGQKLDCSKPEGYAARDGDCLEYSVDVHPDAAERCNKMDDDCDGKLDEGLPIGPQYRDNDGDGYGAGTETILDCSSPKGYAAMSRDCDDRTASTHPQANETCNLVDDDCDGRTDEGVRPSCGVGWCRRLADSCTQAICTPGQPRAEECNLFDDDCDDRMDEDATCPNGGRCVEGKCTPLTAAGGGAAAVMPAAADAGAKPATASEAGSDARTSANVTKPPSVGSADGGGCSLGHAGHTSDADWLSLACAWALAWARRRFAWVRPPRHGRPPRSAKLAANGGRCSR